MSFPARLGSRQRVIAGVLGLGLGFGVPFVLSVALVASSGDATLLILPLPFLGALWAIQGLAPSGFALEYGWGAREIDDATWEVTSYDRGDVWGHERVRQGEPAAPQSDRSLARPTATRGLALELSPKY